MSPDQEAAEEIARLREEVATLRARLARSDDDDTEALRESDARYRAVVAVLTEGLVLQDAEGGILACNAATEAILGLTKEQLMGLTSLDPRWRSIYPDGSPFEGEDHPAMVTLRTGEPQRDVIMGVHKPNGSLTWISINSEPLRHQPGEAPYAVMVSITDVTDYRKVQETLKRRERQLQVALSSARAGLWEWNIETEELWWSDQAARVFGLEPGEFDGSYESYIGLIHPQDRSRLEHAINEALEVPERGEHYEIEHRILDPAGEVHWLYCAGAVLRQEGRPVRMTGVVLDITQLKDLELRLAHLQKMDSVGRLAGGVAHDFNNLLTAILGGAELGLQSLDDPGTLELALEEIRHAAEQGARVTRQLLSFARKQKLSTKPLLIGEVVRDCLPLATRLLGGTITTEVSTDDGSPVQADGGQLEQLLLNLVVNARDAMPEGGSLRIATKDVEVDEAHVEAHPEAKRGRHVLLSVHDTGIGIAPDDLDKIFEPFFTTKTQGTGLGLATCYGIVAQLGGHIAVVSGADRGTTFEVYLPCCDAQPEHAATEPLAAENGSGTILLVDDEPGVLRLTKLSLEHLGYRVIAADGPEAAVNLAEASDEPIDLLLSDVMMPGMNGADLAELLMRKRPGLRALMVSGYARHQLLDDRTRALPLLQKPYTIAELHRRLREALEAD